MCEVSAGRRAAWSYVSRSGTSGGPRTWPPRPPRRKAAWRSTWEAPLGSCSGSFLLVFPRAAEGWATRRHVTSQLLWGFLLVAPSCWRRGGRPVGEESAAVKAIEEKALLSNPPPLVKRQWPRSVTSGEKKPGHPVERRAQTSLVRPRTSKSAWSSGRKQRKRSSIRPWASGPSQIGGKRETFAAPPGHVGPCCLTHLFFHGEAPMAEGQVLVCRTLFF